MELLRKRVSLEAASILFVAVMLLLCCSSDADAYQRKVLAEFFVNTDCPLCGPWVPPAENTIQEIGEDTHVQITYHTWWPEIHDPWYMANMERHLPGIDDIITRVAYYGYDQFLGVPSYFFDGFRIRYGQPVERFTGEIHDHVTERLDTETPIMIEIETEIDDTTLTARVRVISDEDIADLILFSALLEHHIRYRSPGGQTEFFGNMLEMIPDAEGIGFRITHDQDATFDLEHPWNVGWRENEVSDLELVVWVQDGDLDVMQVESVMLGVEEPTVLLVDASANELAGQLMMDAFDTGYLPSYDRWVRDEDGVVRFEDMSGYEVVFWNSFMNDTPAITESEENAIIDYLESGGIFILSSPNFIVDNPNSLLLQRYLAVGVDEPDLGVYDISGARWVAAFEECELNLDGETGAGTPDFTPSLNPIGDAAPIFHYVDGDGNRTGVAAVQFETDVYRALTFAFPLESITDDGETDNLQDCLGRIFDWVENPQSIDKKTPTKPENFALNSIYPNPFNSSAQINFTTPHAGMVSLQLYDVNGRLVDVLIERNMLSGNHAVSFSADALELTNGIYFVKLNSRGREAIGKVVYVR